MKTTKTMMTALALMTLTACNQSQRAAFDKERSESQYQSASADLAAGRLDAAIGGFQSATRLNPGNASAHFQLAVLLQDRRKDYLGAVCSYRAYLNLAPESDKSSLARERARNCERLLAYELAKKINYSDAGKVMVELQVEQDARSTAERELARLRKELESVKQELEIEKKESAARKALLDRIGGESAVMPLPVRTVSAPAPAPAAPSQIAIPELPAVPAAPEPVAAQGQAVEPPPAPPARPQATLEDEPAAFVVNPEALALNEEAERDEAAGRLLPQLSPEQLKEAKARRKDHGRGAAKEAKPAAEEVKPAEAAPSESRVPSLLGELSAEPAAPAAAKTHVVRPGETLMQIAQEHYGKRSAWKRIQEANKAKVSSDGQVRVGQVLVLP